MGEKVYIEQKPEHYKGHSITVTIHTKPSEKSVAQELKYRIEALLNNTTIIK